MHRNVRGLSLIACVLLLAIGGGWWGYTHWTSGDTPPTVANETSSHGADGATKKIIVGDQAQRNLKLTAQPLRLETYWKSITVPGSVVDRPGVSDREVAAPVTGIISEVRRVPGDQVSAGEVLFVIRLTSDTIHEAQASLFKAQEDMRLAQGRLEKLTSAGDAIARARIIEIESEIRRLEVAAKADEVQLRSRGFSAADVDRVASGRLISEIPVLSPTLATADSGNEVSALDRLGSSNESPEQAHFEMQELRVEVGQQVQAGEALCMLSNHRWLAIEGRAFRDEIPLLENSLKNDWPVAVDFQESATVDWPPVQQTFLIRHLSNTVDAATRTFGFLLPLENQSKQIVGERGERRLWRFRPGQKVWLQVRVEKLDNVFVVPSDAVVREGADVFVFTQNVNTFERKGVQVVHQDRERVILANDGSLRTYRRGEESFTLAAVVQNAAAQLNRMTKSGSGDVPVGYHIHADGSLHKNEDEGK